MALDTSDLYTINDGTATTAAAATAAQGSSATDGSSAKPQQQQGLLADFRPLADFAVERRYGVFSDQDGCAFAVKVYDEGNTTCIVVDAGSHGTHVSSSISSSSISVVAGWCVCVCVC